MLILSFLMGCSVPTKWSHGKWGKTISFSDHTQTMRSLSTPFSSAVHYLIFCSSLSSFLPFHFLFRGLNFHLGSFHSTPVLPVLVSDSLLLPSVLYKTSAQCANWTQQMCPDTCVQVLPLHLSVFFTTLSNTLVKQSITPASRWSTRKEEVSADLTPLYICGDDHNLPSKAVFKRYHRSAWEQGTNLRKIGMGAWNYTQGEGKK